MYKWYLVLNLEESGDNRMREIEKQGGGNALNRLTKRDTNYIKVPNGGVESNRGVESLD